MKFRERGAGAGKRPKVTIGMVWMPVLGDSQLGSATNLKGSAVLRRKILGRAINAWDS